MYSRWVLTLLVALIAFASGPGTLLTARGQPVESLPVAEIPATEAGKQLRWLLGHINDDGDELSTRDLRARVAPGYLKYVPASDLLKTIRDYVAPNGPFAVARFEGGVTETRANVVLTTPSGVDWRFTFGVESYPPYRIDSLYFQPAVTPTPVEKAPTTWRGVAQRFKRLAPEVSFLAAEVTDGACRTVSSYQPELQLAIASNFKLYVLGELARQIEAGLISWDDPLAIDGSLRSLPNGDMRLYADGALLPVRTYAEQMISASDNTATDHLIVHLGREQVEAIFSEMGQTNPALNQPLLLTREWFAIKLRFSRAEVRQYLAASPEERRVILATEVDPLADTLSELEDWPGPHLVDTIEWFASAGDLCRAATYLLNKGSDPALSPVLDALSLNPGIAFDARTWRYVGYKGGYETGVNSAVWLLQRQDGRWFVLTGIINDPTKEIDANTFWRLLGASAVQLLAMEE